MKLTLYLFRERLGFHQILREKHLAAGSAYVAVTPVEKLPFECRAYVLKPQARAPKWLGFIRTAFDVDSIDLHNSWSAFVLLLKVEGRIFGLSFGQAFHAIDPASIEPDFGLKVVLSEVDPKNLQMLDTRTVDVVTRQRRTHLNQGSPLVEFGVNPDLDWIRAVNGVPVDQVKARRLAGSDSLQLTKDVTLEALGTTCKELLAAYRSDAYKKHFAFVDYMRPLKDTDPRVRGLEEKLREMLSLGERGKVAIAHPEIPEDDVTSYVLEQGKHRETLDELTLENVYGFQAAVAPKKGIDPRQVTLFERDAEDGVIHRAALRNYLVAEVEDGGETFVLSLGRWFVVEKDHLRRAREQVKKLPDLTTSLRLPRMKAGEHEKDYNERTARQRGWVNLDRTMFRFGRSQDVIECCDLLTRDRHLICVKKMTSSATLSHLFAQGSVSARLLRVREQYQAEVKQAYETRWAGKYDTAPTPTVVYAISTDRKGPLSDTLFFFSLINLTQHIEQIRALGFETALCRIEQA